MREIVSRIVQAEPGEEHVPSRLGKAVALLWAELPTTCQERLLDQATLLWEGGHVQVRDQILAFVRKHQSDHI